MTQRNIGLALAMAAAVGIGACGPLMEGDILTTEFWAGSPLKENDHAELGIAEMAMGNHIRAENHFVKALKANPHDVPALLGQAILYHNTGQTVKARELYQAVLANRPSADMQFVIINSLVTRPASEIASVNLALLDSGAVIPGMESAAAGQLTPGVGQPATGTPPMVTGAPAGTAMLGRPVAPTEQMAAAGAMPSAAPAAQMATAPMEARFVDADANIVSRFTTLRALRDQGLITQEEFGVRRQANVGSLLPLTSPPPAAGLDRPVPSTEQVTGRLRAIGRALEMRAISVSQHASERSMILDALMPSAPVVVANPGVPPQGLLEAADAVRRLEQLRDGGYITSDEYTRERAEIEKAMQPEPMPAPAAAMTAKAPMAMAEPKAMAMPAGPQPGIHLASYRSRQQAERGWSQLRRAHKTLLQGLDPQITRVNLGPGKGVYYRLKAGPVASRGDAATLCRQLKRRRQYCEPSMIEAG